MSGLAVERRGEAVWLWLDRPERRNAFDAALIAALHEAVEAAGADPAVRALVLAGRGESFCAGADVGWMRDSLELSEAENVADAERLAAMLAALDGCPKPTLARVDEGKQQPAAAWKQALREADKAANTRVSN